MKLQIIKRLVRKVFLIVFILFSFILIFIGKPDNPILSRTSGLVVAVFSPVVSLISYPIYKVGSFIEEVKAFRRMDEINQELKAEVSKLTEELNFYKSQDAENKKLREICNFAGGGANFFLITRVLGSAGAGFSHTFILDAGTKDGVAKYHAVLVDGYLVGQIVAVGDRYSRMLLLTDAGSKIPVQVETTGTRAFLTGDNSKYPRVVHFENQEPIGLGDRIVTSGMDGNIPAGIPVGIIGSISEENGVVLQLFVDSSRIHYVHVVKTSHTDAIREFLKKAE
jgi:rod shape-determining protein MreC